MNSKFTAHLCVAGVLAMGVAAGAQQPSTTTAGAAGQTPAASANAAGQQTITGCVVSESDYRKAHDAGKGGVVGTGVGAGNEYILVNASTGASSSSAPSAVGTSGSTASTAAASAMAYELSGSGEGQLSRFVGRRVELTGMFKAGEMAASGQATGGPTAGAPPRGVDVGGKDLMLREFDVASVKEAQGDCPTAVR